ncbi:hypothetical protein BC828DRAFT_396955 [Blastocladiella britannica]|nr:hypothetical protein BC828DRAFT_396955 [Blastocladiella britannica]
MAQRESRIKTAKTFAAQGNRELSRERSAIDRKEAKLTSTKMIHEQFTACRSQKFLQKGDVHAAQQLAKQIAMYRRIGARTFEAQVAIDIKLQAMASNNIINRRELETLSSIQYINGKATVESVAQRDFAARQKMEHANEMESINVRLRKKDFAVNEGMDDIYDWEEDSDSVLVGNQSSQVSDLEIDSILSHALDPTHAREFFEHSARSGRTSFGSSGGGGNGNGGGKGISVTVKGRNGGHGPHRNAGRVGGHDQAHH